MGLYRDRIIKRSKFRFLIGLLQRIRPYLYYRYCRYIAIKNGALIGNGTNIPYALAKRANPNLFIGDNCSIQTHLIDTRSPVKIGDNVIIGENVELITASHQIDSVEWELKLYGVDIGDYVWIATKALILPSCTKIGYGAVVGGGSVVVKNIEEMTIVSGNIAIPIRKRKNIHCNLVTSSLLGGDLADYIQTYFAK